jgi:hypothetical protein
MYEHKSIRLNSPFVRSMIKLELIKIYYNCHLKSIKLENTKNGTHVKKMVRNKFEPLRLKFYHFLCKKRTSSL